MSKQTVVFCEFRPADLLPAQAASQRSIEVAVFSTSPDVLDKLPHSQVSLAKAVVHRVVPVQRWDSPDRIRATFARQFPGRVPIWYTGLDEPSQAVAALRQYEGLPASSPEAIRYILNKAGLKHDLYRNGLSRLVAVRGDDVRRVANGEADWPFEGPGFLQLAFGAGGYGTRKVWDAVDVRESITALSSAVADSPSLTAFMATSGEFVLTQTAKGVLHSFEAVVLGGRLYPLGFSRPHILEADIEVRGPRPMLGAIHPVVPRGADHIIAEVERRMLGRGLTDTFLHVEMMIDEQGDMSVFEELDPNPRLVGAEVQWAMNEAWGISMGDIALDWALGELRADRLPTRPLAVADVQTFLGPKGGGRLKELRLPEGPDVRWSVQFVAEGTDLSSNPVLGGKVGGYLTVGATVDESVTTSRTLRGQVQINGTEATF